MQRAITVAGIQFERRLGNKEYNLNKAYELTRSAAATGAKIISLPELFSTGYFPLGPEVSLEYFRWAEPEGGPSLREVAGWAHELGVHVIAPVFEYDDGFRLFFNTAFLVGPNGVVGKYRKRHIPSMPRFQEKFYFVPGNLPYQVFDVEGVKVGISICFDRHFPETYRHLVHKGAEVVFSVNNSMSDRGRVIWFQQMAMNASSNGIYIVQTNACGEFAELPSFGLSAIAGPKGEILETMGAEEGFVTRTLDLDEIVEARFHYGAIRDTRWEDFGLPFPSELSAVA